MHAIGKPCKLLRLLIVKGDIQTLHEYYSTQ